jgi:hypothetical protein
MDKLSLFITKYSDTLYYEQDAHLKLFWQELIAPSCVNRVIVLGGMDAFYQCCICQRKLLYQGAIMRHYREQHAALMPKDIFGSTDLFECKICHSKFKREEHFKVHLASAFHLQNEDVAFQYEINENLNKRCHDNAEDELKSAKKLRVDDQIDWPVDSFGSSISSETGTFTMQEAANFINMDAFDVTISTNCEQPSQVFNESEDDDDLFQTYFLREDLIIKNERVRVSNQQNRLVKSISFDLAKKLSFKNVSSKIRPVLPAKIRPVFHAEFESFIRY